MKKILLLFTFLCCCISFTYGYSFVGKAYNINDLNINEKNIYYSNEDTTNMLYDINDNRAYNNVYKSPSKVILNISGYGLTAFNKVGIDFEVVNCDFVPIKSLTIKGWFQSKKGAKPFNIKVGINVNGIPDDTNTPFDCYSTYIHPQDFIYNPDYVLEVKSIIVDYEDNTTRTYSGLIINKIISWDSAPTWLYSKHNPLSPLN